MTSPLVKNVITLGVKPEGGPAPVEMDFDEVVG